MTRRAMRTGTLDFDWQNAKVEPSDEGAWVAARVWVPKEWLLEGRARRADRRNVSRILARMSKGNPPLKGDELPARLVSKRAKNKK
jgi:hypothetical protein